MAAAGHIRGFDGLRGLSIILVLLRHLAVEQWLPDVPLIRRLYWDLASGEAGVNIFFALSGFLITRLLLLEQRRSGSIDLRKFYVRRFLRLLPPLLVFLLISSVLLFTDRINIWAPGLLVSFFYLYNFIPSTHFDSELGHTWSLAVEEQFYLFWPFVLGAARRRTTVLVALSIVLLSMVAYVVLPVMVIPGSAHDTLLSSVFDVRRLFIPAVGTIMIGALTAIAFHHRPQRLAGWCTRPWWMLAAFALYLSPLLLPPALRPAALIPQGIAVSMLLLRVMHRQDTLLTRLLEWTPLAYLGRISYGVYVYHVLFMGTAPGQGLIPMFPLNVVASLAFAMLSFELLERRVLRLKERFR